jgi:hypothetical protein
MRLNCQYHPADASVASFTAVAVRSAPRFLVIQHLEGSPGILVTVLYVIVLYIGATSPGKWLIVSVEVPQTNGHAVFIADIDNEVEFVQALYAQTYLTYVVKQLTPVSVLEVAAPISVAVR